MEDAANDTLPEGLVQDRVRSKRRAPADQPAEELPPGTIAEKSTLLLGKDVPAGAFAASSAATGTVKNASGEVDAILANGNVGSNGRPA